MTSKELRGGRLYSIPLSDIEYIGYFLADNKCETVRYAYPRIGSIRGRVPDFLFNAELFDMATRKPASDVVSGGEIHRLTEGYGIAFPGNEYAVFTYKNGSKSKDYVGAYPVLVRNGKCESTVPSGLGGARGRTAIGLDEDTFYVALVPDSNGITLDKLRKGMRSAGARDAINLDGGGSTQYYAVGNNYFSNRAVRGFIGIWLRGDMRTVSVKTSLNIRKSASILGKKVGKYYNGDVVRVLEEKSGWCRTCLGWVSEKYLKKV